MAYEYDTPAAWIGFSAGPFSAAAEFDPVSLSCLARPVGTAPGAAVSTVITLAPDAVWQTVTRLHFASAMPGVSGVSGGLMAGIALPSPPAISRRNQPDLIAAEGWEDGTDGGLLAELGSETESIDNRIDHLLQTPPQLVRNAFLPGKPVSFALHLAARQAWTGRIAGEVVRRPGANPVSLGPKTVTVTPGRTAVIPFTFTPDRAGTWVIRFREGNDRSPLVEIPVTVDKPSGLYLADSLAVPRDGVEFSRYRMERWREPGRFDPHSLAFPVTASIPSPHTAYAKPLSGGPLRLLACFPFITGRKAVELMQRLDCRPDVVLIGGHGYAESTTSPQEAAGLRAPADEVRAMKRALLRKPEVILLAGVVWNYFPDEIRRELLRQTAEEGVPLILAGAINLPPVFRQAYGRNPKPGDTLDASGSLGRGTIRFFSEMAPGGLMRPEFLDSEREWEALCHDLVRLGRGEPSLRVEPPRFAADPGTGIVVVENRGPAPFRGRLELAIRRETGLRDSVYGVTVFPEYADAGVVTRPLSLGPGATNRIVFALPASPPGKERVFAIIRDEQGAVVDWRSAGRSLRSAYRIEGFETLPAAAHSPLRLCRDDDMRIRFRWAGGALEGPVDLEARGVDVAGRELFRVRRAVSGLRNGEPVEMVAPLRRAVRSLLVAQVAVSQGGRVLVEARRKAPVFLADRRSAFRFRQLDNENWFPFTERTIDDFVGSRAGFEQFDIEPHAFGNVFAVPGGPTREEQERLRRAESLLQGAPSAPEADLDFRRSSRLDEVEALVRQGGSGKKAASPIRSPCFHDPDFRAFQKTAVRGLAADPRCPQQVLAVDEFVYGLNACRCDRCARAFSAFLQSGYGDLARLNAEWQTAFRGWDEARLYGIESDFPVPRDADWPRVLDTWMFKAAQHAAFVAELEAEGRAVDPDFAMGYSGTYKMSPFNGLDLFAMAKAGRIHGVYRDNLEWMSFAGPAAVFGWQSGYGAMYNPAHEAARPWELLAAGQSGIGNFTCPAYPMAGPDGSLHEGPRRFFENFDQVRRGPAALLLDCRCYDPVAIYFSSPSFFVHALEWWRESKPRETFKPDVGNGGSVNDWPRRASHLIAGLAAGHQVSPYYVGYGDVAAGAWGPIGKPRILVLPYTPALSREEASRLAAFVREGGLLIGTVNAATRSEHGAPLARPLLDEVFGVRRARPVPFPTLRENAADLRTRARFRLPGMDADLAFTPSVVGPPAALEAVTATVHGRWGEGQTGGADCAGQPVRQGTGRGVEFPGCGPGADHRSPAGRLWPPGAGRDPGLGDRAGGDPAVFDGRRPGGAQAADPLAFPGWGQPVCGGRDSQRVSARPGPGNPRRDRASGAALDHRPAGGYGAGQGCAVCAVVRRPDGRGLRLPAVCGPGAADSGAGPGAAGGYPAVSGGTGHGRGAHWPACLPGGLPGAGRPARRRAGLQCGSARRPGGNRSAPGLQRADGNVDTARPRCRHRRDGGGKGRGERPRGGASLTETVRGPPRS